MDALDQFAQVSEGLLGLALGLRQQAVRGLVGRHPGQAERHGQGHQLLLRAVVQVPLDPAALRFERVDEPGPGAGELK